jgi:hypothetical protein
VLRAAVRAAPRSWTRSRTPTWWPSAAWRRAASSWATRTAGARGGAARAFAREASLLESAKGWHVALTGRGATHARSYEDIGEEDDWETADRDSEGEEEEPEGGAGGGEPGKKRKGDGAKARRSGVPSRRRAAAARAAARACGSAHDGCRARRAQPLHFCRTRVPSRRGADTSGRVRCLRVVCARAPQATKAGGGDKKGAPKEAPRYRSDVQKLFAHAQAAQARAPHARALPPFPPCFRASSLAAPDAPRARSRHRRLPTR